MLSTLLESNGMKRRSQGRGLALSIAAHTGLIGAALYATAQARPEPAKPSEIIRPVYFPPAPLTGSPRSETPGRNAFSLRVLRFVPPDLEIRSPAVDVSTILPAADDFRSGAIGISGSDATNRVNSEGAAGAPFSAGQVEKQAALSPGSSPPRYPEVLRAAGVEGRVVARFIVNEQGRVEPASISFPGSDNQLFADAVTTALVRMRFVPAETGGRKVRQLVEMPFVFTISR